MSIVYIYIIFLTIIILISLLRVKKKTCILLTTAVHVNSDIHNINQKKNNIDYRKKQYIDVINSYIKKSSHPLYVVDSSGYSFPEFKNNDNVYIYSYNLNIAHNGYINKTPMEAISIIKAYDNFKLNRYDNIVKITGKYYIPNIDKYLNKMNNNALFYLQYTHTKDKHNMHAYQATEIFGFKSYLISLFYKLSLLYDDETTLEYKTRNYNITKDYYKLVIEPYIVIVLNKIPPNKLYRFPKMHLNKKIERGCNNCSRKYITYL